MTITHSQFLRSLLHLQNGIMFDRLDDLGFATLCYCERDPSPFWNNVVVETELSDEQITRAKQQLIALNRKPAFYFADDKDMTHFTEMLLSRGYKQEAEDSWMFHSGEKIAEQTHGQVKKVTTQEDLEIFLKTFDTCYQNDDPKNPYGELGEYLAVTRKAWEKHHHTDRIEYFIAFKEDAPVAVASLTNYEGIGYISNVGSLRTVRGEGFGKRVTLHCVSQSKKHGNFLHCLATEDGTNPNQFYTAIGFETKFTAKLLVATANS